MTAIVLTDPSPVFAAFVAGHGDAVRQSYTTGLAPRPGEKLWAFAVDDTCVAWGGVVKVSPGLYSYRAGIFKGHERRGYRKLVRRWLADEAFRAGAAALRTSCKLDNKWQVASLLKSALDGTWMEFRAVDEDTLVFYMTREKWENLK